ncbi:MAG: hypothetical protein A2066_20715 [Bacteroidetes bacterium GWB2_41_8]|nr:MAG: hypothetical protein A2066_20715 [Bacteroidetes bacterium GWB2_41_8]
MIHYRLATNDDNQQLIELTSASGMTGDIALRIDRKPDFFKLLNMRGESKVFVALDGDRIVGSICVSQEEVYVAGEIHTLQYFGDFKIAESYRNKFIGFRLCESLEKHVLAIGADLAFLNYAKGNNKPVRFLSNRPNIPDFENLGVFNIHQFIGKKKKTYHPKYEIIPGNVTDDLLTFLNNHFKNYELANVITPEKLENTSVFTVQVNGKIIAALCLQDTMNVKQNVVTAVTWKMKYLLKILNSLNSILGLSKMPELNKPVYMIYIKYLAVRNNEKSLVRLLIGHARNIAYKKSYSFVSIGVHEKDPINNCFSGLFKMTFNSAGMVLSLKNNKSLIEKVKHGIPFADYSVV